MGARRTLALVTAVFGVAVAGCGSAEPDSRGAPAEKPRPIRSDALALDLPPGWHGDAVKSKGPMAPMLRAATFPLAGPSVDLGQQAQATMGESGILISIVDYGPPQEPKDLPVAVLPVSVDRSHLAPFEGFREPVATRAFLLNGHALQLWVVFGSADPGEELFAGANTVLRTLAVRPRRLELNGLSIELPDGWDGYAKDLGAYESIPAVYSANVAWPDRGQNLDDPATLEPFERLPRGGIVIAASAWYGGEGSQRLERPITLSDGYFLADSYEGQPAPHVSTQLIEGRLGGRGLSVQVYFGRPDPTDDMRAEANAVLATLELAPAPPPGTGVGWREHRDEQDGVSVRYPGGWRLAAQPLTPLLRDPVEVVHVSTYRLRPGGDRCTHVPENALDDLGPADALISLYERKGESAGEAPLRPRHFLPFAGTEPESIDCLERPRPRRFLYRLHEFRDAGRYFHLYVAIGEAASWETRRQTAEILDSLRVE